MSNEVGKSDTDSMKSPVAVDKKNCSMAEHINLLERSTT